MLPASGHWVGVCTGQGQTPLPATLPCRAGAWLAGLLSALRGPRHAHPLCTRVLGGQQLDFSPLQPPGRGRGQARRHAGSKRCCALRSGSEAERGATCAWRRGLWKAAELDSGCATARSLPTERLLLHRSRCWFPELARRALTAAAAGKEDEAPGPPRHSTTRQWGFQSCGTWADLLQRLGPLGAAQGRSHYPWLGGLASALAVNRELRVC